MHVTECTKETLLLYVPIVHRVTSVFDRVNEEIT